MLGVLSGGVFPLLERSGLACGSVKLLDDVRMIDGSFVWLSGVMRGPLVRWVLALESLVKERRAPNVNRRGSHGGQC